MSATDLAVNALRTFGDTQDGKIVDETFDLTGDSLEELQNTINQKAENDLFNSLIDGKSADKRKLNGDGTILSVVQNVTTAWALQGGEYVPHVYTGATGTWTDNLGGDVDSDWENLSNLVLHEKYLSNLSKIESLKVETVGILASQFTADTSDAYIDVYSSPYDFSDYTMFEPFKCSANDVNEAKLLDIIEVYRTSNSFGVKIKKNSPLPYKIFIYSLVKI